MKKDEVLKTIESKGDIDYVVRTAEEEKTFLENLNTKFDEEKIPPAQRKIYENLDEELFKLTGQKRNIHEHEKTTEYYNRIVGDLKTKAEKASVLENEISTLKQQIKDGTGDKKTLADLEAVQRAYKELEDRSKSEVENLKKSSEQKEIRYEITSALSGYNYKKGITEPVRKAFVDQVINELSSTAELREGKLVFIDKAGNPMRNPHNALSPYTAKELLDERLKEIIETGKKLDNGPGIENELVKEYDKGGKLIKASIIVPDTVKTKTDLGNFLVSQKVMRGTPEYMLLYAEYSKNLPMR